MLSKSISGAFVLVTNALFYDKDGNLSILKCGLLAGMIYYFGFLNPMMLISILEIMIIFYAIWLLWAIVAAMFNGNLAKIGAENEARKAANKAKPVTP